VGITENPDGRGGDNLPAFPRRQTVVGGSFNQASIVLPSMNQLQMIHVQSGAMC